MGGRFGIQTELGSKEGDGIPRKLKAPPTTVGNAYAILSIFERTTEEGRVLVRKDSPRELPCQLSPVTSWRSRVNRFILALNAKTGITR